MMDRDRLEAELAAGRSIEAIAREVGKDARTVGYWVRKHGLRSAHSETHASRGGIERKALERLVERGLTVRAIAEELDVSFSTVRHWLERYGLRTDGTQRVRAVLDSLADPEAPEMTEGHCSRHGRTTFKRRAEGSWRCLRCRTEHVTARRRRIKQVLVDEAGGACVLCGYDRSVAALHFHHVDPSTKEFHLAADGATRSIARARAEARKCVLMCANCHAEVESGVATIPPQRPDGQG